MKNKTTRAMSISLLLFFILSCFAFADIDNYFHSSWDNESLNGGTVGAESVPGQELFNTGYDFSSGSYVNCKWNGATCTLNTVSVYVRLNQSLVFPENGLKIYCWDHADTCPTSVDLYAGYFNTSLAFIGTDSSITTDSTVDENRSFILNVPAFEARYLKFIFNKEASINGMRLTEFNSVYPDNISQNDIPTLSIEDLKSVYCYNSSQLAQSFDLTLTDAENDDILYFPYWNEDFSAVETVDDFSNVNYNMLTEGWSFSGPGCNASTDEGFLKLTESCDNIAMIKYVDDSLLNSSMDLSFHAWTMMNTSNKYEIWNWYNEKITGLKIESFVDPVQNELYTNFSYWNGSAYLFFDYSLYMGMFAVEEQINETHVKYCISGLDEVAYDGCALELSEELHGTTDNIPGKFYMLPEFNFQWTTYQDPYVVLDELKYSLTDWMYWYTYAGEDLVHRFKGQGIETLTVLVTDSYHLPEYQTYVFPITVQGLCEYTPSFNETNHTITPITDKTRDYINAIDNGQDIFNNVFWIGMLLILMFCLFIFRDLPVSLIVTGGLCIFVSWYMSGDLTQMISSASLIAFGMTMFIVGRT